MRISVQIKRILYKTFLKLKYGDRITFNNWKLWRHNIGYGAAINKGVTIGERTVVGANSVVTKSLKSNSVYAGRSGKKNSDRG